MEALLLIVRCFMHNIHYIDSKYPKVFPWCVVLKKSTKWRYTCLEVSWLSYYSPIKFETRIFYKQSRIVCPESCKVLFLKNKKSASNRKVIGCYDGNLLMEGVFVLRKPDKCLSSLLPCGAVSWKASTYFKA